MLDDIMKLPTDYNDDQRFVERKSIKGSVEFKNVKFKYPNSSKYILNDVSFKISSGEKVGFIGANGSGKTTILKLIVGLYQPESGSILIDGIDINQINPYDLRRYLSYVPQDIVLFKGTLQENIMNASENLSDEELIEAAHLSGVDAFISQHPQGYNMPIQEQGIGLSGGEKQAIGVLRALIKVKASLVLMDEPTNSMDSTTELKVESSVENFSKNKTMIIVSHKQSLLKLSNRLILLQNGKILLDNSYEHVLNELSQKATK
jgi:ATP-binding cassette subfamily C protein LapB